LGTLYTIEVAVTGLADSVGTYREAVALFSKRNTVAILGAASLKGITDLYTDPLALPVHAALALCTALA